MTDNTRSKLTTGDPSPSQAAHTPGPWRYSQGMILAGMGLVIAEMRVQRDQTMPNARLIAAAPDMLEVCREIIDHVAWPSGREHSVVTHARAALAKATGSDLGSPVVPSPQSQEGIVP